MNCKEISQKVENKGTTNAVVQETLKELTAWLKVTEDDIERYSGYLAEALNEGKNKHLIELWRVDLAGKTAMHKILERDILMLLDIDSGSRGTEVYAEIIKRAKKEAGF